MTIATFFRTNVEYVSKVGGVVLDSTLKVADKIYTPIHAKLTTLKEEPKLWDN